MSKLFYPKLAASNIRKNAKTYIPYILTCICTIMMFYIIYALSQNSGLKKMIGAEYITYLMFLGAWIVGIFAVIFLFYTNSFLIKRRKKEFGLYNILGMEKKHISKVMFFETLYIAVISLSVGIAGGILLSKAVFLAVLKILNFEVVLGFEISVKAIIISLILFGVIFLLTLLNNLRHVHFANPIELLKGGQTGEKEPKTKIITTIIGLLTLGAGYYIAITTKDPLSALLLFFLAVILVIIGTYCLFTAGSIALLKILRKNKNYYYKAKHFTSVSGMMYRMKQNAVGLANIAILSTAALVVISTTVSMFIGMDNMIDERHPRDISITLYSSDDSKIAQLHSITDKVLKENNVNAVNEIEYTYLSFSAAQNGNLFSTDVSGNVDLTNVKALNFIPLENYNSFAGENKTLNDNEVLVFSSRGEYTEDSLKIFDNNFKVKEHIDPMTINGLDIANIVSTHYIIVKDMNVIKDLDKKQSEVYAEHRSFISTNYGFDLKNIDSEKQIDIFSKIQSDASDAELSVYFESKAEGEKNSLYMFSGFLFLGIFLGILFIMATVLIIYYKQISEGYDDKKRFEILQKVGMSKSEVKKTISSQVLTVFFLPLITAGIHITAAFGVITKLLALFSLTDTGLFALCTISAFLIFSIFYAIVYSLTAKVYYKIVS